MDHLAILKKQLHLLHKILAGEKIIESRWYKTKKIPFNRIKEGDTVYFKESGGHVSVKAIVQKVIQYEDLTETKIHNILHIYEKELGIKANEYINNVKDKKYGILIFLENVEELTPFKIDKKGFGSQSSWITVETIAEIQRY